MNLNKMAIASFILSITLLTGCANNKKIDQISSDIKALNTKIDKINNDINAIRSSLQTTKDEALRAANQSLDNQAHFYRK